MVELALAFGGARVPGAEADTHGSAGSVNFLQRCLEVLGQVIAQRPQRGDIKAPERLAKLARGVVLSQGLQDSQKGRESFAGARGRHDEHVPALGDHGPRGRLDGGRLPVPSAEPVLDHRRHGIVRGAGQSRSDRAVSFWPQVYFWRIGPRALRVAAGHSDFSVMIALRRASWQGQFGSEGRVGMTRDKMALA